MPFHWDTASSQSCVFPAPSVMGCPSTGIPPPLRAERFLGFRVPGYPPI
ncbi:mCG147028 [Mus musculus]|nr:mCG147028 [Mus musculus]